MLAVAHLPHVSSDRIQYNHSFIREHKKFAGESYPEFVFLWNDERGFAFVVYFPGDQLVPDRKRLHHLSPIRHGTLLEFEGI